MNIFTADDVGLLKNISIGAGGREDGGEAKKSAKIVHGTVDRSRAVQAMQIVGDEIWTARKNGTVERLLLLNKEDREEGNGDAPPVVQVWSEGFPEAGGDFVGFQVVSKDKLDDAAAQWLITCQAAAGVVQYRDVHDREKAPLEIQVGPSIGRMRAHAQQPSVFATGGKERDLHIYDIRSPDPNVPLFQAKNVKHDMLDMRVPVWINDLQFLDAERTEELVVGTNYSHIRIYDTRVGRRPVFTTTFGEVPIKRVVCVPNQRQILFTDTLGGFHHVDLRAAAAASATGMATSTTRATMTSRTPPKGVLGTFKGTVGAVVDVQCDPARPSLVASVSVDRHLRVHDLAAARKLVHRVYLKQRLQCVAFGSRSSSSGHPTAGDDDDDDAHRDDDVEDVWDSLETVVEEETLLKKRAKSAAEKGTAGGSGSTSGSTSGTSKKKKKTT